MHANIWKILIQCLPFSGQYIFVFIFCYLAVVVWMRIVPTDTYVWIFGAQLEDTEERIESVPLLKGGGMSLRVRFEVSKPSSATLCLLLFLCVSVCLYLFLFPSFFLPLPHAWGSDVSTQIVLQYDAYLLPYSLPWWPWIYPLKLEANFQLNKFVSCLFMISIHFTATEQ